MHDKIVLLGKDKLNIISNSLINSYISHDEFISVHNELRKYNEIKEEIKKFGNFCRIYKNNGSVLRQL